MFLLTTCILLLALCILIVVLLSRFSSLVLLAFGIDRHSSQAHWETHRLVDIEHGESTVPWRVPYVEDPKERFKTFIYAFTWEDPFEDLRHFELSESDSMLVITSGGDNALHYATIAHPRQMLCVDMNACQGHLLELKLAAVRSLEYEDFFALFGKGQHPNFGELLDSHLSPFLSPSAYRFWNSHRDAFSSGFYLQGYSGWAIRIMTFVFRLTGVSGNIGEICNADTLQQQCRIWKECIKPVLLNAFVVALFQSPVFCWNALGVPLNQRRMLLDDGTIFDYVQDTLEPMLASYLLKTQNYFYQLALSGRYTPQCCPVYLTASGFQALKANRHGELDAFRLYTSSITHVLRSLDSHSLNKIHIMDHFDWFSPASPEAAEEIAEIHRVLVPGGFVSWRSAARVPWYNENFEQSGFKVISLGVRDGCKVALDMVNMYASFYKAMKL